MNITGESTDILVPGGRYLEDELWFEYRNSEAAERIFQMDLANEGKRRAAKGAKRSRWGAHLLDFGGSRPARL